MDTIDLICNFKVYQNPGTFFTIISDFSFEWEKMWFFKRCLKQTTLPNQRKKKKGKPNYNRLPFCISMKFKLWILRLVQHCLSLSNSDQKIQLALVQFLFSANILNISNISNISTMKIKVKNGYLLVLSFLETRYKYERTLKK